MNESGKREEKGKERERQELLRRAKAQDPWHRKWPKPPVLVEPPGRRPRPPQPPRRPQVPPARYAGKIDVGPTRERLIRSTLACLQKGGLGATTSREIARTAKTNLQSITYYFGSKDDLVAEALLRAIRSWIDPARTILRSETLDPVSRMVGAVQALQDAFERARPLMPVYLEALVHSPRNDRIRSGVRRLTRELRKLLVEQIAELRETGFLPHWVEPDAMATLLLSTADGLALHAVIDPKAVDPRAVAGQVTQLLLASRATVEAIPPSPRGRRPPATAARTR
jgi:AcrR family transcriptional regulator